MVKVSRRKALGLTVGALGGAGLAGCATPDAGGGNSIPPIQGNVAFNHGVASGDATSSAVILWTRVTPDTVQSVDVTCLISKDSSELEGLDGVDTLPSIKTMSIKTSASRDYTVKLDATGLDADEVYFYRFAVKGTDGYVLSPLGKTRTMPARGGDQLKLAVVSCSNFPFGYFNAYRAIADRGDVDAVVHLGDYIYEYGIDGYGAEMGQKLGRMHAPVTEIVSLEDYRMRHAQYKADADLQAAHAIAPWYCTWDDHESTNNSYRSGAENHNPEENEGDWTSRKQRAVQAYLEWMPVRDPKPGMAREAIYRSFELGSLATLFMLEGRLTGRSDEISWFTEIGGLPPEEVPAKAMETMGRVSDPSRTMLGAKQEEWLDAGLKKSVEAGKTWQVLGNQVIMATVLPPKFARTLTPEQIATIENGYVKQLMGFAELELPFNLDAWDGFPAARSRLYNSAKSAGARVVTLTGDTHTAWANELHDSDGEIVGAEFGCTSITSPGFGAYMPVEGVGQMFADANTDVVWHDPFNKGFTLLTLTPETARADFYSVESITEKGATATTLEASFETRKTSDGQGPVQKA